ncbi:MAG: translation initiation factor IF-2 [Tunicatimonas sp.]
MVEEKTMRLSQIARKFNIGRNTIVDFLAEKGFETDRSPNAKIPSDQYELVAREFASSALDKEEASGLTIGVKQENLVIDNAGAQISRAADPADDDELFIRGLTQDKRREPTPTPKKEEPVAAPKKPAETSPEPTPAAESSAPESSTPEASAAEAKPAEVSATEVSATESSATESSATEAKVEPATPEEDSTPKLGLTVKGKIDLDAINDRKKPAKKKEPAPEATKEAETKEKAAETAPPATAPETPATTEAVAANKKETPPVAPKKEEEKVINAKADQLKGLTVLGKIELPADKKREPKPVASSDAQKKKRKRRRIRTEGGATTDSRARTGTGSKPGVAAKKKGKKEEISDKEVQEQIKETLAKLSGGNKRGSRGARARQERRRADRKEREDQALQEQQEATILKVTEFVSAHDLASLMDVSVNEVISTCMSLGMFVSINQRLDAESITVIADEFNYDVEFVDAKEEIVIDEGVDEQEDLQPRAPIVTIMGHVDHGKTSLLDYIRSAKVTEGEAGGITQHIGAYDVMTDSGKHIAFLDTPGHEAFTAMRARGAKVTDVVIIVVAADDGVMPQTKEALNHAQVAGVPIVIAINKIDKPGASPEKIKEDLANNNVLVEDWGGKYQSQEISAKTGQGIDELLEKVLLEAELLDLKANPNRPASGAVVEATLDKGRGYVTTLLVQNGTLKVGDIILAGSQYGKVKAMTDHRGKRTDNIPPGTPVQVLGLAGAPQSGDRFNVMESDREARDIANKREQIQREQSLRTKKHITLDEIGRRLAIGSFRELNIIVKGDVDGSVEALSDSLLKLSTDEVQVSIIHKGVGQISESDVLLASASDAIIVGFQVRPSNGARGIAEKEEIEIRLYSIIYDAINEIKDAMEGMLAPSVEEVITGNIEVRQIFKISRIGTVAGCYVTDGVVKRNNQIRLVRDGIVAYTGEINQLKREKDDVNEVKAGYECGISIKNFNDIKVGDVIEGFEQKEVKRSL